MIIVLWPVRSSKSEGYVLNWVPYIIGESKRAFNEALGG
jgi:hypothetical protein